MANIFILVLILIILVFSIVLLKFFGLGVADVLGGIVDTVSILFNNWEFYWSKMKLTVFSI